VIDPSRPRRETKDPERGRAGAQGLGHVDQPIIDILKIGGDGDLEAIEPGPAGLEHAGEDTEKGLAHGAPLLGHDAERLERGREEGRPLHRILLGTVVRVHLELERRQRGQPPKNAQRLQLKVQVALAHLIRHLQAQLVHASEEPSHQRCSVHRVLQIGGDARERGEGTSLQCRVDEVADVVLVCRSRHHNCDAPPMPSPTQEPHNLVLLEDAPALQAIVVQPNRSHPREGRHRRRELLQLDLAEVLEVLAHHPLERLARACQPRRLLARQQRQQVVLPHGRGEGPRGEGLRLFVG
jgi:hypothetical protein